MSELKLEEVKRIVNVDINESKSKKGAPYYVINYVDNNSKPKTAQTTKSVYLDFQNSHHNRVFNKLFYIETDQAGVVQNIQTEQKQDPSAIFTEDSVASETQDPSRNLIFEKGFSGRFNLRVGNANVGRDFVAEVSSALEANPDVKAEDILEDKYYVVDVRQNGKYVHVAPSLV